jgi:hypothetical protein
MNAGMMTTSPFKQVILTHYFFMSMKEIKNRKRNAGMRHDVSSPTDAAGSYTAPEIEIIDIELSQNILGGSLPPSEGEPWIP